ncbi:C2H2-type zinc finger transcription factor [Mucor lusitanicus]
MKLRARKKSFPNNIKQEDCKPTALINAQSSSIKVASTSSFDPAIKLEDSKDHKVLLKQQSKSVSKDYYYCCDVCKQRLPNLKSVLEHRKSNHISKPYKSTTIVKNLDKEPDVHNPDFYCSSCEKGYRHQHAYRYHLRCVHYMVLKRLHHRITPTIDIAPDPNDPNLHCRACNFTYKNIKSYKRHCRYAHGLKLAEFDNQTSSSGSLVESYCQTCDKRSSTMQNYRRHLLAIHKKKMKSKYAFTQHLQLVHSIFKSAPPQTKEKPDIDDSNNYCRACQKNFLSIYNYRSHLRKVHQMMLPFLRVKVDHKQLPDPYNRDYYCSHCRQVHFMTLDHHSIVNPKAKINVNGPDLYCSQCERSFTTNLCFKRHLGRVHSIM